METKEINWEDYNLEECVKLIKEREESLHPLRIKTFRHEGSQIDCTDDNI